MAFAGDRIKIYSVTAGTGVNVAINGAAVGPMFCTIYEAGLVHGTEYHYVIEQGNEFEHSRGVYDQATGLIGRTVVSSRVGGVYGQNKINLNGTQIIYFPHFKSLMGATVPVVWMLTASLTFQCQTTKCKVTLIGPGGGAGGASGDWDTVGRGGRGGFGSACVKYLSGLTPGLTLVLTIGAGGAGSAAYNTAGNTGGNTVLQAGTQPIATLVAYGGTGGQPGNSAIGADGVAQGATGGDINVPTPLGYGEAGHNGAGIGYGGPGGCPPLNSGSANGGAGAPGLAILEWYD